MLPHHIHRLLLVQVFCIALSPTILFAQTPRAATPTVTLNDAGSEPRQREAWTFDPASKSRILVSTRTVRGANTVSEVDEDAVSIRRMYSLRGSFQRTTPITSMIWRIDDASARYHDPSRMDGEPPEGLEGTPKFGGAPIPNKVRDDANQPNPTGNTLPDNVRKESFQERFARLTNATMKKLNGASIRQKVEPGGIISTAAAPTMDELSPRIYSEAMNLVFLLGLGEVMLPEQPIGLGASWSADFENEISAAKVRTTITWTLKERTGSVLKLGMTFKRRRIDDSDRVLSGRVDRDGVGEVTVDLANPLQLNARLVVVPNEGNPHAQEISWITIKPIDIPGNQGETAPTPRNEQ